jgi:hypothetical protein
MNRIEEEDEDENEEEDESKDDDAAVDVMWDFSVRLIWAERCRRWCRG